MRRLGGWAAIVVASLVLACADGRAREPLRLVAGGDAALGRKAVGRHGCATCHYIPGFATDAAGVGPPLTHVAQRAYIAGSLANEPENLVRWIMNPQAIEPGTAMPNLGIAEMEARHIAAFLYTLGDELGPPHLLPQRWLHAIERGR